MKRGKRSVCSRALPVDIVLSVLLLRRNGDIQTRPRWEMSN